MKIMQKCFSLILIAAILSSTCLTGCTKNRPLSVYKELGNEPIVAEGEIKLPKRPAFIAANKTDNIQNTLEEFLTSGQVNIEELMSSPDIIDIIMKAENLTDIIRSKKEMTGFKTIQTEIKRHFVSNPDFGNIGSGNEHFFNNLTALSNKIDSLLVNQQDDYTYNGPIKGTWTTPDRIILRWNPEKEWIPVNGFNLFRTINDETQLIAAGLGSIVSINSIAEQSFSFAGFMKDLYNSAWLSDDKMEILGVSSEEEFNQIVYGNSISNVGKIRISGEFAFKQKVSLLSDISVGLTDMLPSNDFYQGSAMHYVQNIHALSQELSLNKNKPINNINLNDYSDTAELTQKQLTVNEILQARKSIITKACVDADFGDVSGLGYTDNLENMDLSVNTHVKYTIVPVKGLNNTTEIIQTNFGETIDGSFSVQVNYGTEIPVEIPQGLEGYGADDSVYLRWKEPVSDYAKKTVSGYNIERRKDGETGFIKINETPVAITYTEEDGILYETSDFFIDREIANGEKASYRINALDIFGRLSEYSNVIDIEVFKVEPPQTPVVGQPDLSSMLALDNENIDNAYKDIVDLNNKEGVIIPITRATEDIMQFAIYRSKAYSKEYFDTPEEIVRINAAPYLSATTPFIAGNSDTGIFIINPQQLESIDILYYDKFIEPGYYYKYWVSAIDNWGNESEWSESKIVGYPSIQAPLDPEKPHAKITMKNQIQDGTGISPGDFNRYFSSLGLNNESNTSDFDLDISIEKKDLSLNNISYSGTSHNIPEIGLSVSTSVRNGYTIPDEISMENNNLPLLKDVHDIIVLGNEDLLPDNTARVSWYHYSGSGITGYMVYRAYADGANADYIEDMTKESLIESFAWSLVSEFVTINQITDAVEQIDGRLYLYMICLIPEVSDNTEENSDDPYSPIGFIGVNWERPSDTQVSYFRVYRAEVPYFRDNDNMSSLDWLLVGDNMKYCVYSEKLDQTIAHYYYYKVTSVSIWGIESEGSFTGLRLPATLPPQTPSMLIPFSAGGNNEINFVGVPNASKYYIYRKKIPCIGGSDMLMMQDMAPEVFDSLFTPDFATGIYFSSPDKSKNMANLIKEEWSMSFETEFSVNSVSKLKAANNYQGVTADKLESMPLTQKLEVYKSIVDKYGVLAVMPYDMLDNDTASEVDWVKAGELNIPMGEDSSGKQSFLDDTAQFGSSYYYTVQALNDDNLASGMPEPVAVFTRKGEAFPPVTNLSWEAADNKPMIYWNQAKDPNLSIEESMEFIAGYVLYRSNTENGAYYQASGLIPADQPFYKDVNANLYSENWYKVRTVDTAGFISEFSQAVLARMENTFIEPEQNFHQIRSKLTLMEKIKNFFNANIKLDIEGIFSISQKTDFTGSLKLNLINPDSLAIRGTSTPTPRGSFFSPTPTPKQKPTSTPTAIPTTKPSNTPVPTPAQTGNPSPTPTSPILPGFTPTPTAFPTSLPRYTATPSQEPKSTNTPISTLKPTATPHSTSVPQPTASVQPSPAISPGTVNIPQPINNIATPTPLSGINYGSGAGQFNNATPTPLSGMNYGSGSAQFNNATPTPISGMNYGSGAAQFNKATSTPIGMISQDNFQNMSNISSTMMLNGFTLTGISIAGQQSGSGVAELSLPGGYFIPVHIAIHAFEGTDITDGNASLNGQFVIANTGIHLKHLILNTENTKSEVSGYITGSSGNIMGDIHALEFNNSIISPLGYIFIYNIPVFHYKNLTFTHVSIISVNINRYNSTGMPTEISFESEGTNLYGGFLSTGSGFINVHNGIVENNLDLATIDNKGLEFGFSLVSFDKHGRLSGTFTLNEGQFMRPVIPAGLSICADNGAFVYDNGNVKQNKSFLNGRVLLTQSAVFEGVSLNSANTVAFGTAQNTVIKNALNNLQTASFSDNALSTVEAQLLNSSLQYMTNMAQSNALLVSPDDPDDIGLVPHVVFSENQWKGKGIKMIDTTMTPTLMGANGLSDPFFSGGGPEALQAIGVTPTKVILDLNEEWHYSGNAPQHTKSSEWMGIIIKGGKASLPQQFIQTPTNEAVTFNLSAGDLLYDRNGFLYQNQVYTPEGVPVSFGQALGEFDDVKVKNIIIDIYENEIRYMQIGADMAVPLLHKRVKVELLKDDKMLNWSSSIAETEKFDPAGNGKIKLKVFAGKLDESGLHIDGSLDFKFNDSMEFQDINFNNMIIPSAPNMNKLETENSYYGQIIFDKPYLINFHHFPMEIRKLSLTSINTGTVMTTENYSGTVYNTSMILRGGMQLSDNMAMNANKDTDKIVIGGAFNNPAIRYEESQSEIFLNFEDMAEFTGTAVPKTGSKSNDIIEYDTDGLEMAFNEAFGSLEGFDLKVNARIGYDKQRQRSFFGIAMYYHGAAGIPLGFGELNDLAGVLGYNLDLSKNPDGTYAFSTDKDTLLNSLDNMSVSTSPAGNYFFALSACMYLMGSGGYSMGQVRGMYMAIEKGPSVEMGGTYFGPATIQALRGDEEGLEPMGTARMGYYHKERLFKFSLNINANIYGFNSNGDIGFQMCPNFWEVGIGYPNMLTSSISSFANVGFGLGIRNSKIDESFIRAKGEFSFDTGDIPIGIVYIRGFLSVGGEGVYDGNLSLTVHLHGGIQGGVKVLGERFNVISLMLDATGSLIKDDDWTLSANTTISYHVDLWLTDVSGSVEWPISLSF